MINTHVDEGRRAALQTWKLLLQGRFVRVRVSDVLSSKDAKMFQVAFMEIWCSKIENQRKQELSRYERRQILVLEPGGTFSAHKPVHRTLLGDITLEPVNIEIVYGDGGYSTRKLEHA